MLIQLALKLSAVSPNFKRFLWKRWYQYLAGYNDSDWRFMNYGYSDVGSARSPLDLQPVDEVNRYAIQLYHRIASAAPLEGLDVLEVGSGRGGGASFIKRYHRPSQMTGVDFSRKAIQFCQSAHRLDGLRFIHGDAEKLPFEESSFGAVINVESSHCYRSMPAFLSEVKRVLKPGGHFLFADLCGAADRARLHQHLIDSGLHPTEQEDITPNVLEALRLDSDRKLSMIERSVPKHVLPAFREFAALEGSAMYRCFRDGTTVYVRYLLEK